jgi:hypothetical protein
MLFLVGVVAAQRFYQPTLVYPNAPAASSLAPPVLQAAPQFVVPAPEVQPRVATLAVNGSGLKYTTPFAMCAALLGAATLYVAKGGLASREANEYTEEIITVPTLAVSGTYASSAATRAGEVQMNTQYEKSIFANIGRKKNPKTGDTLNLKGYTVGSRAPKSAKNSGEVEKFGYGIGNLYGGGLFDGSKPTKGPTDKGVIQADSSGALGKLFTAWLALVGLFVLSNIGGS